MIEATTNEHNHRLTKADKWDIREHKKRCGKIGNPKIDEPHWLKLLERLEEKEDA